MKLLKKWIYFVYKHKIDHKRSAQLFLTSMIEIATKNGICQDGVYVHRTYSRRHIFYLVCRETHPFRETPFYISVHFLFTIKGSIVMQVRIIRIIIILLLSVSSNFYEYFRSEIFCSQSIHPHTHTHTIKQILFGRNN